MKAWQATTSTIALVLVALGTSSGLVARTKQQDLKGMEAAGQRDDDYVLPF